MKDTAKKTIVQEKGKNWYPSQTIAEPLGSKHFENMPSGTPKSRSKGLDYEIYNLCSETTFVHTRKSKKKHAGFMRWPSKPGSARS